MSNVHFQRIRVDRFLGIGVTTDAVALEAFGPGLNVIWAPNGRGKTCTAKAMIALLWANVDDPYRDVAGATLAVDGHQELRELGSGNTQALPGLPPAELAHLYRMSLPDLLEGRDDELVRRIRREIHGNIDLGRAAESLAFSADIPSLGIGEYKTVGACNRALREIIDKQEQVRGEARRLSALLRDRALLQQEMQLKRCYEHLLARDEAREEIAAGRNALAVFPDGLDTLRSGDGDELQRLLNDVQSLAERIRAAESERAAALAACDGVAFGEGGPPDRVWRETATRRLAALHEAENVLKASRERLSKAEEQGKEAEAQRVEADQALSKASAPFLIEPRLEEIAPLEEELKVWREQDNKCRDLEAELAKHEQGIRSLHTQAESMLSPDALDSWLAGGAPITDMSDALRLAIEAGATERLAGAWQRHAATRKEELSEAAQQAEQSDRAVHLLQQWLRSAAGAPPGRRLAWGPLAAALGLAAALVVCLAMLVSPWWLLALVLPAALGLWLRRSAPVPGRDAADAAAGEFNRSGLKPPPAKPWDTRSVTDCLAEHERFRARRDACQTWYEQCRTLAEAAKNDQQESGENQQRIGSRLQAEMGLQPERYDASALTQFVHVLGNYRAAHNERVKLTAARDRIGEECGERQRVLSERLGAFYPAPIADLADATTRVVQLREAADRLTGLHTQHLAAAARADAAGREIEAARQALGRADDSSGDCLQALQTHLDPWHAAPSALKDTAAIEPLLNDFVERADTHEREGAEAQRLAKAIADDETQSQRQVDHISAWLTTRSLPAERDRWEESRSDLGIRLGQLAEHDQVKENHREACRKRDAADAALNGMHIPAGLTELSREMLQHWLDNEPQREADLETRNLEINRIESDIRHIQEGDSLEAAAAEKEEALLALSQRRDQVRAAVIGDMLREFLDTSAEADTSGALSNARELFAAFTRNRYQLDLSRDADGGLVALDTQRSRHLPLAHLSSGTRVQLLLAARLGFLTAQEGEIQPPIILDEALAVSDDERTTAIMDAVIELANRGRQVFYFTAQSEEVDRWQTHMHAGICLCTIGDRPAARESAAPGWRPPELSAPEVGEGIEAYGSRLGIPALQPWDASGAAVAHPWHVVQDPGMLYRCLRIAGESCGACRAFISRVGSAVAAQKLECSSADLDALQRRISILERCLQLWQTGRPRPLGPEDLQDIKHLPSFGAATFDGIVGLYHEHHGDAEAILAAARNLPRFGPAKAESLQQYLEAKGSIGGGERYSGTDVARLLRQEFGDIDDIDPVIERSALLY